MLRRVFRTPILIGLLLSQVFLSAEYSITDASAKSTVKKAPATKGSERRPMSKFSKEINALVAEQEKTWNKGDLDGFVDSYARTKDVVYVSNGSVVRGYDAIRERYKERYKNTKLGMGQLYFTELETRDLGDNHVLCSGKFSVVHHSHVPIYGRFTLIFLKTKDGWKIIYDHSSQ